MGGFVNLLLLLAVTGCAECVPQIDLADLIHFEGAVHMAMTQKLELSRRVLIALLRANGGADHGFNVTTADDGYNL
jgi:hypothetical protein